VELLVGAGYERDKAEMKWFQLRRVVEMPGHSPVPVLVDLPMLREAKFARNRPPLIAGFAVQKADGAAIAIKSFVDLSTGLLPLSAGSGDSRHSPTKAGRQPPGFDRLLASPTIVAPAGDPQSCRRA
jgi:hypothetical protein